MKQQLSKVAARRMWLALQQHYGQGFQDLPEQL